MSYVINPSTKGRKGRKNDARLAREARGKTKNKAKNQEAPEEREVFARKVVVRNLPLNFTKTLFLQHVSPLPDYSYLAFHGPDHTLANQGRCRAYIRFRNEEDVAVFKEKFDGYIFIDSRGHELRCMVEMAPYQRTAIQNQEKADLKCGDIANTEEYKQFLESLEKKKDQPATSNSAKVQANLAALEKASHLEPTLTPLMEFLQTNHVEEEVYRRPPGGRKSERPPRGERASKKAGGGGTARRDEYFPENVAIKQREDRNAPVKPRGKELDARPASATKAGEKGRKDDLVPFFPVKSPGMPLQSQINPALSESERGRHFFAERPVRKTGTSETRPEVPESEHRTRGYRGPPVAKPVAPPTDKPAPPLQQQQPRRSQVERYGPKPPVPSSSRPEDRSRNAERPSPTGNVGNTPKPQPPPMRPVKQPVENPITGLKEFTQIRLGESRPAEETPSNSPDVPSPDLMPDGSARVPNRARPAIQLYQPRGKRRYQN